MNVRTDLKGGRLAVNHNPTAPRPERGLGVRTAVKGGRLSSNHNQRLVGARG